MSDNDLSFGSAGPDAETVQELLALLGANVESSRPTPPRAPSVTQRIAGGIGDALSAKGAVLGGGQAPVEGAFARNQIRTQEKFRIESASFTKRQENLKILKLNLASRMEIAELKKQVTGEEDPFFSGNFQWLVDDAGNRWLEAALQNKETGEIDIRQFPAASTAQQGITTPSGTLRLASQPLTPLTTPEGTTLLNRTSGDLQEDVVSTGETTTDALQSTGSGKPKIVAPPISSDQNVEAIQAERGLLRKAEQLLPLLDKLSAKPFAFGERTAKKLGLTAPGLADIGGREAVTTLDPDFAEYVSLLRALQSVFEEEQGKNRLTGLRLGEMAGFIPRGDEGFPDMRTKIRNLVEDIKFRIGIRMELQPGISSKIGEPEPTQNISIPRSEFDALRSKRALGEILSGAELERYKLGLQERLKENR